MKRAALALLVVAAVAGAALVALRGSGGSAAAAVRHTAEATAATGSSRFVLTVDMRAAVGAPQATHDMVGDQDHLHHRGPTTAPG